MQYSRPQSALDQLALLADDSTIRMPAIRLRTGAMAAPTHHTEPMVLPVDSLDALGRPYLSYKGSWDEMQCLLWEDTVYQVERLVRRFYGRFDAYPAEILLTYQRYFVRKADVYYPRDMRVKPIKYTWEPGNVGTYEVMVRGKAK